MLHKGAAYVTCCNDPYCSGYRRENQGMKLQLRYTDKNHDIELKTNVTSPPTITIRIVTEDLLEFLYLDDILPEEVRLVGFTCNGLYRPLHVRNTQKTLKESGVIDGCTLNFEPTPTAAPSKPCQLTIIGSDEMKKIDYQWYRAITTLGMLLEYIIEKFSLQLVERERIHLLTINEELDFLNGSDQRLSELNLHNGMSVYVQIVPSRPPTIVNDDKNVHVECTYNKNKLMLHVPTTETIDELKSKIKKRFQDHRITGFKLYNEAKQEINLSDSDRTLQSFGIKSDQTIFATFGVTTRNTQSPAISTQSEAPTTSSNTKTSRDKVTVICKLPLNNPLTTQVSVRDTVRQLLKEIETLTQNPSLVISKIYTDKIRIHFKEEIWRCLADLGVTTDHAINVIMEDKSLIHSSIVSKRSLSSTQLDKLSNSHRNSKKPVGLDNLGNSCYINSALQCLAHLPPLTDFFLEGIDRTHMGDNDGTHNDWNPFDQVGDVTGAYAELLWNLWRCNDNDYTNYSIKPNRIKERMGEKDARFATKDQQDTQEFMTFLLDVIHKEFKTENKNDKNTIIKQLFFGQITSTITCAACHKEESTTHPISFLSIPLNRQERTFWINFISKKGRDHTTFIDVPISGQVGHAVDIFANEFHKPSLFDYILAMLPDGEVDFKTPLSEIINDEFIFMEQEERTYNTRPERLEIPQKKSTLENCLEEFFSPEKLEDEWTCQQEKCKKKTTAIKQLKLHTLPSILIIQFKRFSHENGLHQKVETSVEYPIEGLDLKRFLPSSSDDTIYDLIAVNNHMGSISGGHYTAYARRSILGKNDWYKFDDSYVTRVKRVDYDYEIISKNAYLLFYIKRDILNQVTTM